MKSILPAIVRVDANGMTAAGDDTNLYAGGESLQLGYMVNVPIVAEYPDGKLYDAALIQVTPKGMEFFRRELPIEMRKPEGSA